MFRNDDAGDDIFRIEEPERHPRIAVGDAWSWLFPVLGVAVFECFANPGVAVAVACLKFGYPDFRTALWLRRDPRTIRGGVLSLCYLARGLLVSGGWGLLFLVLLGLFEPLVMNNNPWAAFEAVMMASVIVMFTGAFLGSVAAGFALKNVIDSGLRVWMDSTIHLARRENRWADVCTGRRNGFPALCLWMLTLCLLWLAGMMTAAMGAIWDPRHANDPLFVRIASAIFIVVLMGSPAVFGIRLFCRAWYQAARAPEECWS